MARKTGITWTHREGTEGGTWNPWQGCIKKSEGCDHCYMYREKERYGQNPSVCVRSKPPTFNLPLTLKTPHTLFTCSWSDFFNPEADGWRAEAWDIMRRTPQHTYLVLTKLHARIAKHLPADWGAGYPNVWLGVSAENQHWADVRIPYLIKVPAVIHFVSAEPLIGPIVLREFITRPLTRPGGHTVTPSPSHAVDWVIAGGESGNDARPMHRDWARSLRDECTTYGVSFFFKQWGEWSEAANGEATFFIDPEGTGIHSENGCMWNHCMPIKKSAVHHGGDLLDGRQWHEFPEVVNA